MWTWPRIWLAIRHLMDERKERKRIENNNPRQHPRQDSGTRGRGGVTSTRFKMKYDAWAAEEIDSNGH